MPTDVQMTNERFDDLLDSMLNVSDALRGDQNALLDPHIKRSLGWRHALTGGDSIELSCHHGRRYEGTYRRSTD